MTNDDEEILSNLLLEWEELREAGESISLSELSVGYPHLTAELAYRVQILASSEWLDQPLPKEADVTKSDESVDGPFALSKVLGGRYRLERMIAVGGFAQVWQGYDRELQRPVAIKIPRPERLHLPDIFLAEARRVAGLKHPSIVQIYDVGRQGQSCFIVSELIEGGSLRDVLREKTPTHAQAIDWLIQIAEALDYAHQHGVIHRDIKPANILIDHHGRALLSDFGISHTQDPSDPKSRSPGTPSYFSPEQFYGREIDPRSDLYSLGIMLHEVITGELPISTGPDGEFFELPKTSAQLLKGSLAEIYRRSVQRNPAQRYASARRFALELRQYRDGCRRKDLLWSRASLGLGVAIAAWLSLGLAVWAFRNDPDRRRQEPSKIPPLVELAEEPDAFSFDGQSRIVTPVEAFFPCTLEAWFRSTGDPSEQFLIGSDVPSFFGIGIGINRQTPIVETVRGGFDVPRKIPSGQWTHLAAVYTTEETRLFLNGEMIGVGPATGKPARSTRFVIGNVGELHENLYFRGQIRSLRISQGARYEADFEPDPTLRTDAGETPPVLIYQGASREGDRIIDLSGLGNDGRRESKLSPDPEH